MANFQDKFKSNNQEWETPQWLFDELNREFNFNLDVCASENNHKCLNYFTKDDDALTKNWVGTCYMNPPYSKVGVWIDKACNEAIKHNNTIVCLILAKTNTNWWHDFCMYASEIRLIQGRIKFEGAKHGLPWPTAIVIFRGQDESKKLTSLDIRNMSKNV